MVENIASSPTSPGISRFFKTMSVVVFCIFVVIYLLKNLNLSSFSLPIRSAFLSIADLASARDLSMIKGCCDIKKSFDLEIAYS